MTLHSTCPYATFWLLKESWTSDYGVFDDLVHLVKCIKSLLESRRKEWRYFGDPVQISYFGHPIHRFSKQVVLKDDTPTRIAWAMLQTRAPLAFVTALMRNCDTMCGAYVEVLCHWMAEHVHLSEKYNEWNTKPRDVPPCPLLHMECVPLYIPPLLNENQLLQVCFSNDKQQINPKMFLLF